MNEAAEIPLDLNSVLEQWKNALQLNIPERQPTEPGCQHEYVRYVGLRETYNFCVRCDHKDFDQV